jgi:pimeloyl-ACP methyl ester carboxylesterase
VICHGFKGYMDYGFLPRLADEAARQGVRTHRFNFSHSGVTRDFETFARPDLFERDTWMKQVHDLTRVIDTQTDAGRPLVVFGHSRGGVTALLTAAGLADRVAAVITAATPADAVRLDPPQRKQLLDEGRIPSPSGRTGQRLHVGRDWLTQIEADPPAHDPLAAARRFPGSLLMLHGSADTTVPVEDLARYREQRPDAACHVIDGANHVFDAPNPLPDDAPLPKATAALFDHVVKFSQTACGSA